MKKPLKTGVRELVESQSLDEEQLRRFNAMLRDNSESVSTTARQRQRG